MKAGMMVVLVDSMHANVVVKLPFCLSFHILLSSPSLSFIGVRHTSRISFGFPILCSLVEHGQLEVEQTSLIKRWR